MSVINIILIFGLPAKQSRARRDHYYTACWRTTLVTVARLKDCLHGTKCWSVHGVRSKLPWHRNYKTLRHATIGMTCPPDFVEFSIVCTCTHQNKAVFPRVYNPTKIRVHRILHCFCSQAMLHRGDCMLIYKTINQTGISYLKNQPGLRMFQSIQAHSRQPFSVS